MQTEEQNQTQQFFSFLRERSNLPLANDSLQGFRERAWDHLLESWGFPREKARVFSICSSQTIVPARPERV